MLPAQPDVAAPFSPTGRAVPRQRRSRDGTLIAGISAAERLAKDRGGVGSVPAIFGIRNGLYQLGISHRRRVINAQTAADSDRARKSKGQLRWPAYLTFGLRMPATLTTRNSCFA